MSSLQADIEARLAAAEPQVEVLLAEVVGGAALRLFIDHPDGVSLELCERVTHSLNDVRERWRSRRPASSGPSPSPPTSAASSAAAPGSAPATRATATRASRASSSAHPMTR